MEKYRLKNAVLALAKICLLAFSFHSVVFENDYLRGSYSLLLILILTDAYE